jgi:hypothetical protein
MGSVRPAQLDTKPQLLEDNGGSIPIFNIKAESPR